MALQKTVRGFSSFIGLFRGGNFQMEPVPALQPVIEMQDWLGPNKFQVKRDTVAAVSDEILFTVPDARFWRAKWCGSYYESVVGSKMLTRWLYRPIEGASTGVKIYLDQNILDISNADSPLATNSGHGLRLADFNLRAGDEFGIEVTRITGGPFSVDTFLQYQEIEV